MAPATQQTPHLPSTPCNCLGARGSRLQPGEQSEGRRRSSIVGVEPALCPPPGCSGNQLSGSRRKATSAVLSPGLRLQGGTTLTGQPQPCRGPRASLSTRLLVTVEMGLPPGSALLSHPMGSSQGTGESLRSGCGIRPGGLVVTHFLPLGSAPTCLREGSKVLRTVNPLRP